MMLPLATTTVAISRSVGTGDPYEPVTPSTIATGVRAHVSAPAGSATQAGGDRELVDAVVYLPATPRLTRSDTITDQGTGETWSVVWSRVRQGLGLDHQMAGVRAVTGESNG